MKNKSKFLVFPSYIFDPQDVQTAGYINEINNFKSDSQDGGKFKGKHNVDLQVHKNELQNTESQPSVNRSKVNNTRDAIRNQRNTALQVEGFNNCREKSNLNINGVHSYSNLKSNHNTNQNKEVSTHACLPQLPSCPAKGPSQPKESSDTNLEADHTKGPLAATESSHNRQSLTTGENGTVAPSDMLEAQSDGMCSPDPDFSKNAVAGSESPSNNHTHSTQSREHTILNKHGDQALCKVERCDSRDQACRTGALNGFLKDKGVSDIPSEASSVCYEEVNGEFEEEDADVAEALAALEAATAGEDFEEEED